jgi:hypothetical protein
LTYLLGGNRLLGSFVKLLNGSLIKSEILLATDENDGQALAEMENLGDPLQLAVSLTFSVIQEP